jgi:DNA-binding transcriptional regulator LsrR (DeoR family)
MSLLQEALAVQVARKNGNENVNDEMIELAVAHVRHEVTAKQVAKVLGIKQNAVTSRIHQALASGIRSGRLVYTSK